jgi:ABC-type enterochelin transport system permease subunit
MILYNLTGYLISSDHQFYRVSPLKTPFGLLIPLLQSSPTRHYNHAQLFLTLLRVYTIIILTRQYSILSVSITHIYTSNKHSVHTLGNCFLPRTYCLALTLKTDCLDISVPLINPQIVRAALLPVARSVSQQLARWGLCYVTVFTTALPWKRACCRVTSSRLRGTVVYRSVTQPRSVA